MSLRIMCTVCILSSMLWCLVNCFYSSISDVAPRPVYDKELLQNLKVCIFLTLRRCIYDKPYAIQTAGTLVFFVSTLPALKPKSLKVKNMGEARPKTQIPSVSQTLP